MTVSDGQKVALVVGAGAVVWLMTRKGTPAAEVPLAIMPHDDPDEPDYYDKVKMKDWERHKVEELVGKMQAVAEKIK